MTAPSIGLMTDRIVAEDVVLQVVNGNGWDQALDAGEVLTLGTSPRGEIARVFLGSRGAKIIRHSPVPVLVLPASTSSRRGRPRSASPTAQRKHRWQATPRHRKPPPAP